MTGRRLFLSEYAGLMRAESGEATMDEGKLISVTCPNCGAEANLLITTLVTRFHPRCNGCLKGIVIDRAWMLAEIARLQRELRLLGADNPRAARPGAAGM